MSQQSDAEPICDECGAVMDHPDAHDTLGGRLDCIATSARRLGVAGQAMADQIDAARRDMLQRQIDTLRNEGFIP